MCNMPLLSLFYAGSRAASRFESRLALFEKVRKRWKYSVSVFLCVCEFEDS